MISPLRNHKSYLASLGHRLSGLALVLFLPFHFLFLGSAFDGVKGLDQMIAYTENALVKFAEWGLVVLLAVHFLFGIRVLVLELTRWPAFTSTLEGWVLPCFVASLFIGLVFLFHAI
jgi:fumarate reductase subunit D